MGCSLKQTPEKADALIRKAVAEKSEALCGKIKEPAIAEQCQTLVAGAKEADLFNQAVAKGDPSFCEKLSTLEAKTKCSGVIKQQQYASSGQAAKDSEAFDKAIAEGDVALCDQVGVPEGAEQCKEMVVGQKESDLINTALAKGDPGLCEKLTVLKAKCIEAIEQQNYKSSGQEAKDSAIFDKAVTERKEALCDQISLAEGAVKCREMVAGQKQSDLFNQAVEKKDPALCANLSSAEAKAQCVQVIEGLTTSNTPG